MKELKNKLLPIGVFAASFLLIWIFSAFDAEAFLIDDNRTQWIYVIDRAYGDLFRTGKMPVYDFFQLKGFKVADPGYYSIMNPLMLVSYAVTHFTPLSLSTLTFYSFIMYSFGNMVFFKLCQLLGRNVGECTMFTAAYSVMTVCFGVSYWYYSFNNYLFIPLLIYVLLKTKGKRTEYFGCGIVLAFELLCGNVQFTCYHYMLYGIISLLMIVFKNRRQIGVFFSNIIVAGVLSAPFLIMMLRVSGSFYNDEFLSGASPVLEMVIGSFLPTGILSYFGINLPFEGDIHGREDQTWLFNGGFSAFWLSVLISAVIWYDKNRPSDQGKDKSRGSVKKSNAEFISRVKKAYHSICADPKKQLVAELAVSLLFFTSFANGDIVAHILSVMPVIKGFRFLFKVILIVGPVFAILTVASVPLINEKFLRRARLVCCVFIAIGAVNVFFANIVVKDYFTSEGSIAYTEEKEYGQQFIDKINWDTGLYRYATYMQYSSITPETYLSHSGFIRNFATSIGAYSLSAYEIAADPEHLEQIDMLYNKDAYATRMINAGDMAYLLSGTRHNQEEFAESLKNNAVKYLIIQKAFEVTEDLTDYATSDVVEALGGVDGISVAEVISVNDYFDAIVLDGVDSLCTDGENAAELSCIRMDTLSFAAEEGRDYTLSFAYNKGLTAYLDDESQPLEVTGNDFGNTVISIPQGKSGTVYLTYKDSLCMIGFVFEGVITVLFVALCIMLVPERNKKN
ncbi:hypothetical protein SAMN02910447_00084 [Ruminococcus sp. YE71]|uniref:hypothetical protein n=1 Tax=unclassified Ruminococcus TaxID=2608920 RepID=UPI000890DAE4|nr:MULTISPECIES: hypothetical protein [unclassified Ruminococcus]SDA10140.1 hypothetical protein SAMN02910446_00265 [Ruminococcus sp. YE78]SFW11068.1 hypothetical protein SAMN02910447_00084 [Ruminococcus sp. YE71]